MNLKPPSSCVFCRILCGELTPGVVAYRDAHTAAFPSKAQQPHNQGHMLVVPVRHVAHIYGVGGDFAGPLMTTLARVAAAVKAVCAADGITIRQNNEHHAGQDVLHLHFHVIPRFANDGFQDGDKRFPFGAVEVSLDERVEQARKLSQAMKLIHIIAPKSSS
jgi:histidine triad (HIT) family protein